MYPQNEQEEMIKNEDKIMKEYEQNVVTVNIPLSSQNPYSYYILDDIINEIQKTLKHNNINIDSDILFGTIPIDKVNSGQKNFDNKQNLIIAYEGMFKFYYYMAAVLCSFYTRRSTNKKIEIYDMNSETIQESYNLNKYGHDKFVKIMKGFKNNNFSTTLDWFQKDFHINLARRLWHTAELFNIAHEYGHILLNNNYVNKNKLLELQCDYIALQITICSNSNKNWETDQSYVGIDFMFTCMELLEKMNHSNVKHSHPTIYCRKELLREVFKDSYSKNFCSAFKLAEINHSLLLNLWDSHKGEIQED